MQTIMNRRAGALLLPFAIIGGSRAPALQNVINRRDDRPRSSANPRKRGAVSCRGGLPCPPANPTHVRKPPQIPHNAARCFGARKFHGSAWAGRGAADRK
ncbi:MAG: hypothetical protein FWH20_04930 [Oscillospiraceae bacterium]|nr:hypothetical protein [Oscillospiraceae bacterium]